MRQALLAAATALLVGCEEPSPALPAEQSRTSDLVTCDAASPAPGWLASPLVASGGATTKTVVGAATGPAIVVLQNGDGLGAGAVRTARVLKNGRVVLSLGAGDPFLDAVPLTLAAGDVLALATTGPSGSARLSVAPVAAQPCALAKVSLTRSAGRAQTASQTFARPDGSALGLVVVQVGPRGSADRAHVNLNGRPVFDDDDRGDDHDCDGDRDGHGPRGRLRVAPVLLRQTNVLDVRLDGRAGRTVTATVLDVDTTPPAIAFTAPAEGAAVSGPRATASGTASSDATQVSVAGVDAPVMSGAWTVDVPVAEGTMTLTAVAKDFCGNAARACRTVTVSSGADTTPPQISVTGVSAGDLVNAPVVPRFTASDANLSSVTATLDGAPFVSGTAVTAEGDHLLVVTALDQAQNRATVSVPFSLDFTPPQITVGGIADGAFAAAPVEAMFGATDAHLATLSATLDGAAWHSGDTVSAEGPHQLVVTAIDGAGNRASASVAFTVDLTAPVISIAGVQQGQLGNTPVTPSFGADETWLASVTATVDGAAFNAGDSVTAEGDHLLVVTAVDRAGNTARASVAFSIDLTPPQIALGGFTDGATTQASVTPVFTATDAHLGTVTASLSGAPFHSGDTVSAPGAYTLTVVAADGAGNQATASGSFTIQPATPCVGQSAFQTDLDALDAALSDARVLHLVGQPDLDGFFARDRLIGMDLATLRSTCTLELQNDLGARIVALTQDLRGFLASGPVGIRSVPPLTASVFAGGNGPYQYSPVLSTDPEGFVFSLSRAPEGAGIDPVRGTLSWTPSVADKGPHDFTIEAAKGAVIARQAFTVFVSELTFVAFTPVTSEGTTLTVAGTGTDADGTTVRIPAGMVQDDDFVFVMLVDPPPPDGNTQVIGPAISVQLASGLRDFDPPIEIEMPPATLAPGQEEGLFRNDPMRVSTDTADYAPGWQAIPMAGSVGQLNGPGTVTRGVIEPTVSYGQVGNFVIRGVPGCEIDVNALKDTLSDALGWLTESRGFMDPTKNRTVSIILKRLAFAAGETFDQSSAVITCSVRGTTLRNVVAHELFHIVQYYTTSALNHGELQYKGGARWWMEATAELVAAQFTDGKGMLARLTEPLEMVHEALIAWSTDPGDPAYMHQYDSFIFFDFLTKRYGFDMQFFWAHVYAADLMQYDGAGKTLLAFAGQDVDGVPYMPFVHAYWLDRTSANFSFIAPYKAPIMKPLTVPADGAPLVVTTNAPLDELSSSTVQITVPAGTTDAHLLVTLTGTGAEAWIYRQGESTPMMLKTSFTEQDLGVHSGETLWVDVGNRSVTDGAVFSLSFRLQAPRRYFYASSIYDSVPWPSLTLVHHVTSFTVTPNRDSHDESMISTQTVLLTASDGATTALLSGGSNYQEVAYPYSSKTTYTNYAFNILPDFRVQVRNGYDQWQYTGNDGTGISGNYSYYTDSVVDVGFGPIYHAWQLHPMTMAGRLDPVNGALNPQTVSDLFQGIPQGGPLVDGEYVTLFPVQYDFINIDGQLERDIMPMNCASAAYAGTGKRYHLTQGAWLYDGDVPASASIAIPTASCSYGFGTVIVMRKRVDSSGQFATNAASIQSCAATPGSCAPQWYLYDQLSQK